jgi:hypothetical protein
MARDVDWWLRASAVRIGTIWIPSRQVEATLARYTKQLFCLTHVDDFPYAFLGSATGIRFGSKCYLVWCRHQTRQYKPDDVTIPVEDGKMLISGSRFLYVEPDNSNDGEDFTDLCAMEFQPENYGIPNLDASFFSLNEGDCWRGNADAQFFLYGFPTTLRNVDYEVPHVHVCQVTTSGRYIRSTKARALHCIEMTRTARFSADGLSGGAVYHLAKDSNGYFVGLAGTIMRGGEASNYIHFLDVRFLMELLKRQSEAVSKLVAGAGGTGVG